MDWISLVRCNSFRWPDVESSQLDIRSIRIVVGALLVVDLAIGVGVSILSVGVQRWGALCAAGGQYGRGARVSVRVPRTAAILGPFQSRVVALRSRLVDRSRYSHFLRCTAFGFRHFWMDGFLYCEGDGGNARSRSHLVCRLGVASECWSNEFGLHL